MPYGIQRSDEERLKRHKEIFGEEELPPRGTGLERGTAWPAIFSGTSEITEKLFIAVLSGLATSLLVGYIVKK